MTTKNVPACDDVDLAKRNLFRGIGVVAGAAAIAPAKAAVPNTTPTTSRRYAMVIDLEKCYGCHACAVACKAQNEVPLGVFRSWVKSVESGRYPDVELRFLPRLCNQCTDPPCVRVCPVEASFVDAATGIVRIDQDTCIGCEYCITACPYEARFLHPEKKVTEKCDFCYAKVIQGELPACVEACPARARTFGDLTDERSEVSQLLNTRVVRTLGEEHGTGPNVFYVGLDEVLETVKVRVKKEK